MKDFSAIVKLIKEASPFDIFLVSFVSLPFVLSAWLTIWKELGYQACQMRCFLFIVIFFYTVGIVVMSVGMIRKKKRELAKDRIIAYLQSRDFTMMSFDRVREKINRSYRDPFLNSVIESFPSDIRHARLKGAKKGVALVTEETAEEHEAKTQGV